MEQEGIWLSITEYSAARGVSVSSIRRYIKSSRVKYKLVDGKYYLLVSDKLGGVIAKAGEQEFMLLKEENKRLWKEVQRLREEIAENKMLISVYESSQLELPPLPN